MKKNMSYLEAWLRRIFGIVLVTWAIAGGPLWAFLGVFLIVTGTWKFCPVYAALQGKSQDNKK